MFASLTSRIIALGLVVSAALVVFVWALIDASTRTREAFRWVTHSSVMIETMDTSIMELREAESGLRGFVLTRNPAFIQSFEARVTGATQAIGRITDLTDDNPVQDHRAHALKSLMEQRVRVLREPLDLARGGDFAGATAVIGGGRGRDLMAAVSARTQDFLNEERALQTARIDDARQRLAWLQQLALIGGPIILLLVGALAALIIRGIRKPLGIIREAMSALGKGDRDVRVTASMGSLEFTQLAAGYNKMADRLDAAIADQDRSEQDLQAANEELTRRSDTLRERGDVIELLGGMAHRMQAARTDEELAQVIRLFVPRVLPGIAGALYAHNNSRNLLVPIAAWSGHEADPHGFPPDQCWSLRRGQAHFVTEPGGDIVCGHVDDEHVVYHCEPLLAGGEVIGTLHLRGTIDGEARFRLTVMAENIASALVNHRLQRGLREQSIRDPLTGLFNRRYMEETLALEIARSRRSQDPLSLVMCDVDHFKRFNDEFGHDAGDAVLQAVAAEMRNRFRDSDILCRYGGEEFTIIAPGTTSEALAARVEMVREAITQLSLRQAGRPLGSTSMSFGIATWMEPMDRQGSALIQTADAALYRAKREGRNRAVLAFRDAA